MNKKLLIDNDYEGSIKREDKPIIWIDKEVFTLKRDKDKLQQENKQLKDKLKGVQEERDYLFNKQSIENKYLAQENKQLKEREKKLIKIEEMYKSGSVDLDELYEIVVEEK